MLIFIFNTSLGRNPVRLTPGLNIQIPFYHQVSRLDLRESSISIPNVRSYFTFGHKSNYSVNNNMTASRIHCWQCASLFKSNQFIFPQIPHYQVPVLCSGSLFYRVFDGYKVNHSIWPQLGEITDNFQACFEVSDVEQNVKNTGMSAVRSVLGTFTYDQVGYFLILQSSIWK